MKKQDLGAAAAAALYIGMELLGVTCRSTNQNHRSF